MSQLAVSPFLIDGQWVAPRERTPATWLIRAQARPHARVGVAERADVDRAVAAATDALRTWRTVPVDARRALIDAFADGIERHCDELVGIEVRQAGKLTREVQREIPGLVTQIRSFGALAETSNGTFGTRVEASSTRGSPSVSLRRCCPGTRR